MKKKIIDFTTKDVGLTGTLFVRVESIKQTSGPTIFTLFDGSKAIKATAFIKPGARAFPEIQEGDYIKAFFKITEHENEIELALKDFDEVEESKKKELEKVFEIMLKDKSSVGDFKFIAKSDILEKLRARFKLAATVIKKAIIEGKPIILRHHADCDGYCAALALEKAILPLIIENHDNPSAVWKFYKRAPSRTPFYDYQDATKDIAFALSDTAKFGQKEPLIILADNGSCDEDLLAVHKVKIFGARVVVVDHHASGDFNMDPYVDAHINPHRVGGDGNITAGMLCVELAKVINPDIEDNRYLAALSSISDRSDAPEKEQYQQGQDIAFLKDLAMCVDFEAYHIGFIEGRELIDELLSLGGEKQKRLVALLKKDIEQRKEEQLKAGLHYVKIVGHIAILDLDKCTTRGNYPSAGRVAGMVFDKIKEAADKMIIFAHGADFITIRSNLPNFNLNEMIKQAKKEFPYAMISGGGHECAGTLKCIPAAFSDVLAFCKGYVK